MPSCGADLGQPDRGFHRLDLAEKRTDAAELVMPPVLQQARGFWCDAPVVGALDAAPLVHLLADGVDHGRGFFVFLGLGGKSGIVVEQKRGLCRLALALLGLGDGGDELCPTASLKNLLGRLALRIELPVTRRVVVGRIEDGVLEELVVHYFLGG